MPKFPEEAMRAFSLLNGILALIMGVSVVTSTAQDGVHISELPVEWITVDDGLPQGMVRSILQDRAGYLWFATKDGLARSDGYGYTVFRHDPQDSTSVCANHISALYEDRAGDLWIGTDAGAVDRYEPRTGVFRHVLHSDPTTPGVSRPVRRFAEEARGTVLALVSEGTLWRMAKEEAPQRLADRIAAMAVAPNGALWTLTENALEIATSIDGAPHGAVERIALHNLMDARQRVNFALEEGDVIFVPKSGIAEFGYFTRQLAAGLSFFTFGLAVAR